MVKNSGVRPTTWKNFATEIIEDAQTLQQIPAPTFAEADRMRHVAARFESLGLEEIDTDDLYNVYGVLPAADRDAPGLMVVAHTDTVFPASTDLTLRKERGTIYGPGLGDNSIGVAGLFGLVRALRAQETQLPCNLYITATSREEGLGDLGGMRGAYARLQEHVKAVINVEGLAFGHIYHAGIAVRRLHITASTEGGHSWLHFGRESAIHGIIRLGAIITRLQPPTEPRTTFNIGIIEGGRSINTIANEAGLWLDMRSEAREAVEALEEEVRATVDMQTRPGLHFEIEVVGDRPAGQIPPGHPLVKLALDALQSVGVRGTLETGSTDGNVSLAAGCPTVTVGITRGGNAHRLDEYIETEPVKDGLKQLVTLVKSASETTF